MSQSDVLGYISDHPGCSGSEIEEALNLRFTSVHANIRKLLKYDLIDYKLVKVRVVDTNTFHVERRFYKRCEDGSFGD
jgi:predicted transcriptional regulator